MEAEIAEELRRREIEAKKPKRGRPRKKRAEEPAPETVESLSFEIAREDWSASDSAAGYLALARFAERTYDKHIGYGYEELSQWLRAAAMAFDAGDINGGSFYALCATKQMQIATTNMHKPWAMLGLKAFTDRWKHGNRYDEDEDGNRKRRHPRVNPKFRE